MSFTNFATGQGHSFGGTYLELDLMDPKEHRPMEIAWTPENPYIPSVPSTNIRLTTHVDGSGEIHQR